MERENAINNKGSELNDIQMESSDCNKEGKRNISPKRYDKQYSRN
jgi:hypothetical protein